MPASSSSQSNPNEMMSNLIRARGGGERLNGAGGGVTIGACG